MHRCACSTRVLELFIQDVAGLSIRRQRPQSTLRPQRQFGTRPPPRQLQTVAASHTDNDFVPFDLGKRKAAKVYEQQKEVDEDWSPAIELVSPLPSSTLKSKAQTPAVEEPIEQTNHNVSTIDAVSLPDIHHASPQHAHHVQPPVLPQPFRTRKPKRRTEDGSVKSSRMARKQRRQQAGIWAPSKQQAEQGQAREVDVDQLDTVLSKIDELEGPDIAMSAKTRPATGGRTVQSEQNSQKQERPTRDRKLQVEVKKPYEKPTPKPKRETWQIQKSALSHKFGDQGWQPRKRLSPDTVEGIRALHASDPHAYTTATLSEHFKVTPEAIRRILKSKWRPNEEEAADRRVRWERRGVKKWAEMAEQGVRPPAKWRAMGAGSDKGLKEERIPKRRKKRRDERLGWDDVVGEMDRGSGSGSVAERLL